MAKPKKPTYNHSLGAVVAPGILRHPLPCTPLEAMAVIHELQAPTGAATPTIDRIHRGALLKQLAASNNPVPTAVLQRTARMGYYAIQVVLDHAARDGLVQQVGKHWALTAAGYTALGMEPPVERLLAFSEAANAPLRRPGRPAKEPATAKPGPRSDAWYREQILRALAAGSTTAGALEDRMPGAAAVRQALEYLEQHGLVVHTGVGIEVWSLTDAGRQVVSAVPTAASPAAAPPALSPGSPARPSATPPTNALPVFDSALPPVPDWSTRRVIPGEQYIAPAYCTYWHGYPRSDRPWENDPNYDHDQLRFRADRSYVRPTPRPSLHRVLTQYPDAFAGLANPPSIPGMVRQPMPYRPGTPLNAGHEMLIRNGLHPGMDLAVLQRLSAKDIRAQERAAGRPAPMMPGDEA